MNSNLNIQLQHHFRPSLAPFSKCSLSSTEKTVSSICDIKSTCSLLQFESLSISLPVFELLQSGFTSFDSLNSELRGLGESGTESRVQRSIASGSPILGWPIFSVLSLEGQPQWLKSLENRTELRWSAAIQGFLEGRPQLRKCLEKCPGLRRSLSMQVAIVGSTLPFVLASSSFVDLWPVWLVEEL